MLCPKGRVCPSWACKEATEHVATGVEKMCWSVEEAGCVPCINAAVLIKRLVVFAKRESKGVGVRHVSRLRMQFALRFFPVLPHMHDAKEISHRLFRETCVLHWKSFLGRLWLRSMIGF